jgi:hypothetical protein
MGPNSASSCHGSAGGRQVLGEVLMCLCEYTATDSDSGRTVAGPWPGKHAVGRVITMIDKEATDRRNKGSRRCSSNLTMALIRLL